MNGQQKDIHSKEIGLHAQKHVSHYERISQRNWGNPYDHQLMCTRIITLIMDKALI